MSSAGTGLVAGSFNNLNLNNNFNFASNGNVLPTPGFSNTGTSGIANGSNPAHSFTFTGLANSNAGAESATSTFLAQDQLYSQFRLFAVNSQGEDFQRAQFAFQVYLGPAYGFGSGTWPNRPWMPAAYNLGLANHQFGYSSQSDMGLQSAPPWSYPQPGTVPVAQAQPRHQLGADDATPEEQPQQAPFQKPTPEQEQLPRKHMDDTFDQNEDAKRQLEKPASESERRADEALMQQESSLPDPVLLSALAPAPMSALLAGLPGLAPASEGGAGGDAGAEAPE